MFEDVTFEQILTRMLETVPLDIDKREGSIIYNALAPAAIELKKMYIALDVVMNETFADTASRTYLVRRTAERGIEPYPATKAILKGEFNKDIEIGSRFSLGELTYEAILKIGTGEFQMQCEAAGEIGNSSFGRITPIEYIQGLTSAEITELLIPGEDEESTEDLRDRYIASLGSEAFGGNVADYKEKTKAIDGVGAVKVVPVWDGGGTVKLIILDSTFSAPTQTTIDTVQAAIDPAESSGQGYGVAPIGHEVTVVGATEDAVDISFTLTFEDGWAWVDVEASIQSAIDDYFEELTDGWEDSEGLVVRLTQIESRILDLDGVIDISGTEINETAANYSLASTQIPIRGAITNA